MISCATPQINNNFTLHNIPPSVDAPRMWGYMIIAIFLPSLRGPLPLLSLQPHIGKCQEKTSNMKKNLIDALFLCNYSFIFSEGITMQKCICQWYN